MLQENDKKNSFWKFPLFYLANENIQQKTEQENPKKLICNHFEISCSGFPGHPQYKRVGITEIKFFVVYPILIHTTKYVGMCLCNTNDVIATPLRLRLSGDECACAL